MAAPLRNFVDSSNIKNLTMFMKTSRIRRAVLTEKHRLNQFISLRTLAKTSALSFNNKKVKSVIMGVGSFVGVFSAVYGVYSYKKKSIDTSLKPSDIEATKFVKNESMETDLKLKLFQYRSCPFCCKVRSILDYYGMSYELVEVNSVTRRQLKWTSYKKVPVLVSDTAGPDNYVQLKESSLIMSLIETHLVQKASKLEDLLKFYPEIDSKDSRGKKKIDYNNKYFIMYQDKKAPTTVDAQKEEVKWRRWVDEDLVHVLSPNVYRTMSEAVQTFKCFSAAGEWDKNHTSFERFTVIYVGAFVMYFIGKMLKKKYNLDNDVRESLYGACSNWVRAVGTKRLFMGGDQPNLADLSVFGVLSSIEGCDAFNETLKETKIGPWYYRTKQQVQNHGGAKFIAQK